MSLPNYVFSSMQYVAG